MKYFQNMTDAQIEVIAKWLEHQGHDPYSDEPQESGNRRLMTDREMIQAYGPDTCVRTLYENDTWLVFISIDSCIEVVNAIYKPDFAKSESIELGYYEEIK